MIQLTKESREYIFGMEIPYVKPYYKSWKDLYQSICNHYGKLTPPSVFDWYFAWMDENRIEDWVSIAGRSVQYKDIYWRINLDYVKARMWEESKNLPYRIESEDVANMAIWYADNHLNFGTAAKLGEWLKNIALSERERIINEMYGNRD